MLLSPAFEPAQTINYLIAGYSVIFVVVALYIFSLVIRWNNLKINYLSLTELESGESQ